jgi:selenocysteine lyase/cysteine desulfurase
MLYVKRDRSKNSGRSWPRKPNSPPIYASSKRSAPTRPAPKLAIGEALLFHNGIGGKRKEARLRYLVALLDEPAQRRAQNSVQHFVRPEPIVRNCKCSHRRHQSRGCDEILFDKHHIFAVPIMHEEFQGIRITPNLYTTFSELDRFCEQMELIARKGLPV